MERWSFMSGENAFLSPLEGEAVRHCQNLLACLRAQYWSYQQSHWQSMGPGYYGNHLLFERLYESVQTQVDTFAEKLVAKYGSAAVNSSSLSAFFLSWVSRWESVDDLHKRGLLSEMDFQNLCGETYDALKLQGALSLGMDDFLMATANEHETNQYLLKQVLRSQDSWASVEA